MARGDCDHRPYRRALLPDPGVHEARAMTPYVTIPARAWEIITEARRDGWYEESGRWDDLDAIIAAGTVSPWQPIETAPKDGAELLLCGGKPWEDDWLLLSAVVARWAPLLGADDDPNDFRSLQFGWVIAYWETVWAEYKAPTHWMSLPKPP
jgi:hypothetical protein